MTAAEICFALLPKLYTHGPSVNATCLWLVGCEVFSVPFSLSFELAAAEHLTRVLSQDHMCAGYVRQLWRMYCDAPGGASRLIRSIWMVIIATAVKEKLSLSHSCVGLLLCPRFGAEFLWPGESV